MLFLSILRDKSTPIPDFRTGGLGISTKLSLYPVSGKGISTPILDPSAFSKVSVPSENAPPVISVPASAFPFNPVCRVDICDAVVDG